MEAASATGVAAPPWGPGRTWNENLRARVSKYDWAATAIPAIAFTVFSRWTGFPAALGLGVLMSLLGVTLLVPVMLLRPRPYEDMPRSAFACVLAAPTVLFVGLAATLMQLWHDETGLANCTAWAAVGCNVLCNAWSIFRDRYMDQ